MTWARSRRPVPATRAGTAVVAANAVASVVVAVGKSGFAVAVPTLEAFGAQPRNEQ